MSDLAVLQASLDAEVVERMQARLGAQVVERIHGRDVTHADLSAAFKRVQHPENWKFPIDTVIEIGSDFEMETIRRAVIFFAGCDATFAARGRNQYRVEAIGYYAAVGA